MAHQHIDLLRKFIDEFGQVVEFFYVQENELNKKKFGIFITKTDECFVSGENSQGQLGLGDEKYVDKFVKVEKLSGKNIVEIFKGNQCMFGRTSSSFIYGWGGNNWGQLARGIEHPWGLYFKPEIIQEFEKSSIIKISCGKSHNLALSSNGCVYGWGDNFWGQTGADSQEVMIATPTRVQFLDSEEFVQFIYCCKNSSFAISKYGLAYIWGKNDWFKELPDKVTEPAIIQIEKATTIVCYNDLVYYISNKCLYLYESTEIEQNVQDICVHRNDLLILKSDGVYSLNSPPNLESKSFELYFIRELKMSYHISNFDKIKLMFQSRHSVGSLSTYGCASLSKTPFNKSLSVPVFNFKADSLAKDLEPHCSYFDQGETDILKFQSESMYSKYNIVFNMNFLGKSNPIPSITSGKDLPMTKDESNENSKREDFIKFINEFSILIDVNHKNQFETMFSNINQGKNDIRDHIKQLLESKSGFENKFKNEKDIKPDHILFAAINFGLEMVTKDQSGENSIKLFLSYFEFCLSYFKLNFYKKNLKALDQFSTQITDSQFIRKIDQTLFDTIEESYKYYEKVAEHDSLFPEQNGEEKDQEPDEAYDDFFEQFSDDEQVLFKFISKPSAVSQWLKQSLCDIYESGIQKDKDYLITPSLFLSQANEVINHENNLFKTEDQELHYKYVYKEDDYYFGHIRYVIMHKVSNLIISYQKFI